jgi:hypothetical protein
MYNLNVTGNSACGKTYDNLEVTCNGNPQTFRSAATTQYEPDYSSAKGATGPLRHSWRTVMTKEANGTTPELIVLGWDDEGKPRAARFPVGQADLVVKAATAMKLTVCKADGAALAELAKKLGTRHHHHAGRRILMLGGCQAAGTNAPGADNAGAAPRQT